MRRAARCRWSPRRCAAKAPRWSTSRRALHGRHAGRELAPRDVVARAIWRRSAAGAAFFSTRAAIGASFAARFPSVSAIWPQPASTRRRERSRCGPPSITTWAASRWTARAQHRSTGCGPAAKSPRPACTAPTASPAILCTEAVVFAQWVADDIAGAPRAQAPRRRRVRLTPRRIRPRRARALVRRGRRRARRRRPQRRDRRAAADRRGRERRAEPAAVGLMIASPRLAARRSRGAHFRADFPGADAGAASR